MNGVKEHKRKSGNNSNASSRQTSVEPTTLSPNKSKRRRLIDKISYEDLGTPIVDINLDKTPDPVDKNICGHLHLDKVERYLHGPVPVSNLEVVEEPQDLDVTQDQIIQDTQLWAQRTPHKVLVSAKAAVNALGELSPGGALMRGFQEQSSRMFYFK